MEIIRTYGNIIKKYAPDHPLAAFRMIKAGLALEQFRSRNLADKKLPGAYQYLNTYAVGEVLEALKHPETSVWANILPGWSCCNALVCTACPSNVCLHFCPDLPLRTISLTMRKMKDWPPHCALITKISLVPSTAALSRRRLCGHHVNHL